MNDVIGNMSLMLLSTLMGTGNSCNNSSYRPILWLPAIQMKMSSKMYIVKNSSSSGGKGHKYFSYQ